MIRDYPELPLNTPVRLLPAAHEKLQLTFEHLADGFAVGSSEIEEYKNSQFKWREVEDGGQGGIYTRILKPKKSL